MIVEPVMMNAGIIKPEPGYLARLKQLLHSHDALLTFDEVKTGLTVGPGGVTREEDVQPDLITLAKSLGGGVSVAAIGGTAQQWLMAAAARDGRTNGNRLPWPRHGRQASPREPSEAYAVMNRYLPGLAGRVPRGSTCCSTDCSVTKQYDAPALRERGDQRTGSTGTMRRYKRLRT